MLEELKKRVIAIAQSAQRDGLCKHKSGNFSMRDPETNFVVITPSGVDRELLTPEDMVVIDLDANVIEYRKGIRPSSEVLMHLMIYKTRPAVMAVAHTHSMYASVFAVLGKEIPAVVYEAMVLGLKTGVIPVAPYGRPGSMELAESVIEPVKISDALLLARHGALAVATPGKYLLLLCCGILTAAPLSFFADAATKIPLSVAGKLFVEAVRARVANH